MNSLCLNDCKGQSCPNHHESTSLNTLCAALLEVLLIKVLLLLDMGALK